MSFDFNKLNDYKVAIDDGFYWEEREDDGNEGTLAITTTIFKTNYGYILLETSNDEIGFEITESCWETFKKKVADYFLGVDEK